MTLTGQKKTDDGRVDLLVSIDSAEMNSEAAKTYNRKKGSLTIPGFRKGKAPRTIIERMYGELYFYDEALNGMIQDVYIKALEESDADVIDQPRITVESISAEEGVKLVFSVLPRPRLEITDYKGLKVTKHIHPVVDEDINSELNSMREKNARMITVSDRAARTNDITVIDFEGFLDNVVFEGGKGENYNLTLGSGQFIPGFEEQIEGHNTGDEFEVDVTFPADYNTEHLAGKDVVFKVALREIREKELPELDDEFAKDVSEFETIDELKADIKEKTQKSRDLESDTSVENHIGDLLAEQLIGDIPQVMVESRIDDLVRDFSYQMESSGLDLNTYLKYTGQDIDTFRSGLKENAERQVKIRLSLEAVARAEEILITDQDIEAEYVKMSENYKVDLDRVKIMISSKELKKDLEVNKALDIVKQNAEIHEDVHDLHEHDSDHKEEPVSHKEKTPAVKKKPKKKNEIAD